MEPSSPGAHSPRRIFCELASLPTGVFADVVLSIDDGVISAVEVGVTTDADDVERLPGLTMPGFANAHSHVFHRALRGRTHAGRGDFWSWRQQMYEVAARLTPENYLDLAKATFAEMVLAGYTCVGEFHYVHHQVDGQPYADSNAMGASIIDAAAHAGIRLTLLDACYIRGGADKVLAEEQLRFSDGTVDEWATRVDRLADGLTVRVGAAVHSVRSVDADSIARIAGYAARRRMPLHAHVSEQRVENDQVLAEYGRTPTGVLAHAGALSPQFTAVHATHLVDDDIAHYAQAGSTCCFCPTTERDLADGIGPSSELSAAGVPLSIGSDQHAVIDPFEEMRGIEMDERLRSMKRGTHSAADLLAAGSANGYRCLGWETGGRIEAGALADLTTVSLGGVRLAGHPADAILESVVFAATAADVTHVMIAGQPVVRGGSHVSIDVEAELSRAIAAIQGTRS